MIFKLANEIAPRYDDVEDYAQEAYAYLYQHMKWYKPEKSSLCTFVYRVTKQCMNKKRKKDKKYKTRVVNFSDLSEEFIEPEEKTQDRYSKKINLLVNSLSVILKEINNALEFYNFDKVKHNSAVNAIGRKIAKNLISK